MFRAFRARPTYYEFGAAKAKAHQLADRDGIRWCVLGHEESLEGMVYTLYNEHELLFSEQTAKYIAHPLEFDLDLD